MTARDFHSDLRQSLKGGDEAFWSAVYQKAFANLLSTELCTDLDRQRQGIDRILRLKNGRVLYVDEKKREQSYRDILLEYISNSERNTPGWIEKDLCIDYLAYAFMPQKRAYLFPWAMLFRAWYRFGDKWIGKYPRVVASTRVGSATYHTISCAVPIEVLTKAVSTAAIIDVRDILP